MSSGSPSPSNLKPKEGELTPIPQSKRRRSKSSQRSASGKKLKSTPSRLSQSKLDVWVVRSPVGSSASASQREKTPEIPAEFVGCEADEVRRPSVLRRDSSQSSSSSWSGKVSASTQRSSSIKSIEQFFSGGESVTPLSSHDSFLSESDLDHDINDSFDITKISTDPSRQKQYLANHLSVQRRLRDHRLDVGPGSLPLVDSLSKEAAMSYFYTTVKVGVAECLTVLNCKDIWTYLDSEEEKKDLGREHDEGWLEACRLLVKFVTPQSYPQAAALHKFLTEAVQRHGEALVRAEAYSTLLHCLVSHPPGPEKPTMTVVYLEMMSFGTPHVGRWQFSNTEPWDFLCDVLEQCTNQSANDENSNQQDSGNLLVLKFIAQVCQYDLEQMLDVVQDRPKPEYKPLLGRILCPTDSICWSKRMQLLCKYYTKAITTTCPALETIRKLVGLTAQLVQLKERHEENNSGKVDMARFLAFQFQHMDLSSRRLWGELYLLEPAWLSSQVSREMLVLTTNTKIPNTGLRPILTNFVEANLALDSSSSPALTSTPQKKKNNNNEASANWKSPIVGGEDSLEATSTPPQSKSGKKPKINVIQRNKYGETALHTAAKRGNLERLRECLATPGVEVNCEDYNGYTPLSEAVSNNRVEAVRMLLEYKPPSETINKFFKSPQASASSKKVQRVDILHRNKMDKTTPFLEAVILGHVEIVRMILEFVGKEEEKSPSSFPSVAELLKCQTVNGFTARSLAETEELKSLIAAAEGEGVRGDLNEEGDGNEEGSGRAEDLRTQDVVSSKFSAFLELSISKYLGSNSLPSVYRTVKHAELGDLLKATRTLDSKIGDIEFVGGFKKLRFGKKPSFEVFRREETKEQDLTDYQQLMRINVSENHPLSTLMKNMAFSKV